MTDQHVTIERDGRVAVVRFDRGTRANALSLETLRQLRAAATELDEDPHLSAVVLTGRADNFSLGADLKDPENLSATEESLAVQRSAIRVGPRVCEAWERLEPITIAAIEGWCVGGGAALAVSLDLRVAASDATIYVPEIERGMNMSWGAVPRFVNLIGPARTKRALVLAEKIDAERAERWGLIDEVAAPSGALDVALGVAERVASLPPVQVRMIKRSVDLSAHALNATAAGLDGDQYLLARSSDDFREGVVSFLEGREPRWTGG